MPVLAKIAANDMQLMSDTEVSGILDMDVHIKAERMELNSIVGNYNTNEIIMNSTHFR